MTMVQIIVTLSGIFLSILVIWFFFFSKKQTTSATSTDEGVQEVFITVKGGYSPDVIVLKQGQPARLNFLRHDNDVCSEQVLFGDFNRSAFLTPHQTVPVEFTPDRKGEFEFTCGMGMLRGKLIVE